MAFACAELVEVLVPTKPLGVGGTLGPNPFFEMVFGMPPGRNRNSKLQVYFGGGE